MSIRVICGSCQASLKVKDQYAGKSGKCPQCGGALQIPSLDQPETPDLPTGIKPTSDAEPVASWDDLADLDFEHRPARRGRPAVAAPAPNDPSQVMREILNSFQGDVPHFGTTLAYRLATLLVAIFMVLLPLAYLALIGCMISVLVWHATTNHIVFGAVRGVNAAKGATFLYIAPIIAGVVAILFMMKPLFAPRARKRKGIELSFGEQPLLHSFVMRLCEAMNVTKPTLIEVDCSLGATAYFRNGWWGIITNDLVIRVGLPVIATLETRELAEVLAHELSHFSQRSGMRLTYLIHSINDWFYRIAFEEDAWDEAIDEWGHHENSWIAIIAMFSHMCVILGQLVLIFLYVIGHIVNCGLLRQMEYNADKFGIELAGSDVFEGTTRRLIALQLAQAVASRMNIAEDSTASLPDNLPLCLSTIVRHLPPSVADMTDEIIKSSRTGWLHSEPCYRDRIAAAQYQRSPGIFRLERPASLLLHDVAKLGQAATLKHYNRLHGKSAAKRQLVPTSQFLAAIGMR